MKHEFIPFIKFSCALIFMLITNTLCSQSLEIIPYNTSLESEYASSELSTNISVINLSDSALNVKIKRNIITEVTGSENYFCWNYCNLPSADVSSSSIVINALESNDNSLSVHYSPNGIEGETIIQYCAFDLENQQDSACTFVYFNVDLPLVWLCVEGSCVDTLLYRSGGGFSTLEECQANCFLPTYECLDNQCVVVNDASGSYNSIDDCQSMCLNTHINEQTVDNKRLLKITNSTGREIRPTPNVFMIEIYDDGSVRKKLIIE